MKHSVVNNVFIKCLLNWLLSAGRLTYSGHTQQLHLKKHKKQRQTNPMISFYFQQQTKSHFWKYWNASDKTYCFLINNIKTYETILLPEQ